MNLVGDGQLERKDLLSRMLLVCGLESVVSMGLEDSVSRWAKSCPGRMERPMVVERGTIVEDMGPCC